MATINLAGRKDVADYFEKSGIRDWKKLTHTPLLVFLTRDESIEVRIIDKPVELLALPDDTPVMGQWKGEWRSDFFQFTVGQLRMHIAEHPKSAYRVI
jgi:hypothetical protein